MIIQFIDTTPDAVTIERATRGVFGLTLDTRRLHVISDAIPRVDVQTVLTTIRLVDEQHPGRYRFLLRPEAEA